MLGLLELNSPTMESEGEAELRKVMRQVDQAANRALPAPKDFSPYEVIDKRIDVAAQKALINMKSIPAARPEASRILSAVKSGRLGGIYGDDLLAAAQLAKKLNTVRWELVPKGHNTALVFDPTIPSAPPTIIFRQQLRSNPPSLITHLLNTWNTVLRCDIIAAPSSKNCGFPVVTPSSDQQVIDAALADSSDTMRRAVVRLNQLESAINSNRIDNPQTLAFHQNTLAAIQDRLKVGLTERFKLLDTVRKAKFRIMDNLTALQQFRSLVRRDDAVCLRNEANSRPPMAAGSSFAWATVNVPSSGIVLCPKFFLTCRECQRDVITHEFFHLIGLRHMVEVSGLSSRSQLSTEQSLQDANEMAQLVSHIATGLTDACSKFDAGKPCNQPIR